MGGVPMWLKVGLRHWLVWVVAGASVLAAMLVAYTDRARQIDFEIEQNLQMSLAPATVSRQIVVVEITRNDLPVTPTGLAAAMPRHLQAELTNRLKQVGASVLVFDLLFDSRPQPKEDPPLRDAILNCAPLRITLCEAPIRQVNDDGAPNGELDWFAPPAFLPKNLPANVELGQSQAVDTGASLGSVQLECVNQDTGRYLDNIALVAFRQAKGIPASAVKFDPRTAQVSVGDTAFQVGPDGDFLIDWQSGQTDLDTIHYSDALAILRSGDPRRIFRNKIVLVGNPLGDPLVHTVAGDKTGLQMVAGALNTLVHSRSSRPSEAPQEFVVPWTIVVSLAMAIATSLRRRKRAILLASAVAAVACLSPVVALWVAHLLIQPTPPLIGCIVASLLGFAAKAIIPHWYPMPATEPVEATVLVVDIKDSTPLFERLGSKRGSELVAQALDVAAKAVAAEHGEVIHNTGDGFIAVFLTAPSQAHSSAAIRAALAIVVHPVDELGVEFRAGIESGMLDQGARGLQGLPFHYATRLEGLCAMERERLLIGPRTATYSSAAFRLQAIGRRNLKGIRNPVAIFKVIDDPV